MQGAKRCKLLNDGQGRIKSCWLKVHTGAQPQPSAKLEYQRQLSKLTQFSDITFGKVVTAAKAKLEAVTKTTSTASMKTTITCVNAKVV